jgi:four helix bundle protein
MLDHERLDVYTCSIAFVAQALKIIGAMPTGQGSLVDQLRRAAISVPLNIAEGTGKVSVPDRKRFYAIARGSAMECAAIVDVVEVLGCCPESETVAAKEILVRIVSMLTKMTR